VERDLGSLQHLQQFVLSPVQAGEQLAQLLVAGALPEDVVKALGEDGRLLRGRLLLPKLQIAVERPDLVSDRFQLARLLGCFRHQLLQQPLGVNPAQGMIGDAELSGIVGHDHRVAHQSVMAHRAPKAASVISRTRVRSKRSRRSLTK
jgi:hypothetical protein